MTNKKVRLLIVWIVTVALAALIFHFSGLSTIEFMGLPVYKTGFKAGFGLALIISLFTDLILTLIDSKRKKIN